MPRIARSRVKHLERLGNLDGPPIGRRLFLLPDLWPEPDRAAFANPAHSKALGELVERRTGVRPTFGMEGFWAITVPPTAEMLAMTEEEKEAFLEAHESRSLRPDQWEWGGVANGDWPEEDRLAYDALAKRGDLAAWADLLENHTGQRPGPRTRVIAFRLRADGPQ